MAGAKTLSSVEDALNGWLKPKVLGEGWDNIGLLVGSGRSTKDKKVISGILICNDLKPAVVEEAIVKNANLVIAYHPPIFSGLKRISYGSWKEEIIARCLAHDISIYSPHTTIDAVAGGMNDRVIEALKEFGSAESPLKSKALIPNPLIGDPVSGLKYSSSRKNVSNLLQSLKLSRFSDVVVEIDANNDREDADLMVYGRSSTAVEQLQEIETIASSTGISEFKEPAVAQPAAFGAGRIVKFNKPVPFSNVVDSIKRHLNLPYVQVGFGGKNEVETAAVCVGSGESLFADFQADVFITGEMKHHAILDCTMAGSSVILCNHCSSERHYLPKLASIVKLLTNIDNVFVSEEDKSPLTLSN